MAQSQQFTRDPQAEIPFSDQGLAFKEQLEARLFNKGKHYSASDGNPGHAPYAEVRLAAGRIMQDSPLVRSYVDSDGQKDVRKELVRYFASLGIHGEAKEQEAPAAAHGRHPKHDLTIDNIIPGLGVTNLYSALIPKLKKDSERQYPGKKPVFLMSAPTYGLFAMHPDFSEFEVTTVPLRADKKFHLQPADLDKTIADIEANGDKKVVAFYNINPHNPTGAVLEKAEVEKLAEVLKKRDVFVVDDMVHHGLEYGGRKAYPFAAVDGMFNRSITLTGISKTFSCPSIRAGVACGREEDIRFISREINRTIQSVPIASQYALAEAFSMAPEKKAQREDYLARAREHYEYKYKLMKALLTGSDESLFTPAELNSAAGSVMGVIGNNKERAKQLLKEGIPGVTILNYPPESGYFLDVDFSAYKGKYCGTERIDNSTVLAAAMVDFGGTLGIPSAYMLDGKEHPMMMRFTFAGKPEKMAQIAKGVRKCLEKLTDNPNPALEFSLDNPPSVRARE